MRHLDPSNLDTAFVKPGTPTFAQLMADLETVEGLSPTRRRDLRSGLRRVGAALGRPLETIPADPRWLQPRLSRVAPAGLGMSPKSWSNILSDLQAALSLFGLSQKRQNRSRELGPDWRPLWEAVLHSRDKSLSSALSRFVFFLDRQGVSPDEVGDNEACAYLAAVEASEVSKSPQTAYRAAVQSWNLAVRRLPIWPRKTIVLPSRRSYVRIPLDRFPDGFREDLDAYLHALSHPDPFADVGPLKALRPSSIQQYRAQLLRFASAVVHAGEEIERIDSLAALLDLARFEMAMRWLLARNDNQLSRSIAEMAERLCAVGRRHLRLPKEHQAEIERMAARLAVAPQRGMTAKNRDRLRAVEDPAALHRLLVLPDRLFEMAEARGYALHAHLMREDAIAVAILLYCPIRKQNLTMVHLERNLQRPGDGRVFLVFEPGEVKNGRRIEFELPASVVAMIDRHVALRSPTLCPRSDWLFPRRDGSQPMSPDRMSCKVAKRIRTETGLTFNLHLFRHLSAKLYLDTHPGAYEAVRRLLGHTQLSRTLNAYAGFEAGTAVRLHAAVVDRARLT